MELKDKYKILYELSEYSGWTKFLSGSAIYKLLKPDVEISLEKGLLKVVCRDKFAYYLNGKLHREDGPAKVDYEHDRKRTFKYEAWYREGKLHREDGPAFKADGEIPGYYLFGKYISENCFIHLKKNNISSLEWFRNREKYLI